MALITAITTIAFLRLTQIFQRNDRAAEQIKGICPGQCRLLLLLINKSQNLIVFIKTANNKETFF